MLEFVNSLNMVFDDMNPAGDDQGTGGADAPAEGTPATDAPATAAPAEGGTTGGEEGGAE